MNEIWKDIDCFPNYQVSNWGRVKSLNYNHTKQERILRQAKDTNGYALVCLYKNGKTHTKQVHRLVADAFLQIPDELKDEDNLQVNHINELKNDNRIENLCWISVKENCNWGNRNGRISKANKNGKLSKAVLQYSLDGTFIKEFPSAMEVKRQLGFSQGNISSCCRGEFMQRYGFIWKYKNEE